MMIKRKKVLVAAVGSALVATAAYAATQLAVKAPIALSDGGLGDKPKIQRSGDGTLVVAYGDAPAGAGLVYDVKAEIERKARDVFVKTCKPGATKSCNSQADWSAPINVSNSALQSSMTTDWKGTLGDPSAYPGDIDKPNIKTSGPMMVLTWVSKYCPDGDLATAGIQPPVQRSVRYLERDSRIIPFSCTWTSYSANKGASWSPPVQLSNGERDAMQDSSGGTVNTDPTSGNYNKGQIVISWQEDPQGLQLGAADGPGDGASGAKVSKGTDVWYTYAAVDIPNGQPFTLAANAVRLTDNYTKLGIGGTDAANPVFDAAGVQVNMDNIESGQAGASRPNIGMVGSNTIMAFEETKGSEELDSGKFVRYMNFPFNAPVQQTVTLSGAASPVEVGTPGCIISNPLKNARRVRFLVQSPTDAGPGGMQLAIFWKEGIYDKGGPSDIMVRRGLGGVAPSNMQPAVDGQCATSDYATALTLGNSPADNISSNTPTATVANLADDSETNYTENALAHRGVLRGNELWIGYNYTGDLVRLWAQLDNYNFWLRKYNLTTGWANPVNLSNITDTRINVREPRILGTPKSSLTACPSGNPADPTTTDPTQCQNTNAIYTAWGTQENVSPFDPDGGSDLGIFITQSSDGAASFSTPVRLSVAKGALFDDPESAYEAQIATRPDGNQFYAVWNQADSTTGLTAAEYTSGDLMAVADTATPAASAASATGGGGGCSFNPMQNGGFDPTLPGLIAGAIAFVQLRRMRRKVH
jgi:hypothetical protein